MSWMKLTGEDQERVGLHSAKGPTAARTACVGTAGRRGIAGRWCCRRGEFRKGEAPRQVREENRWPDKGERRLVRPRVPERKKQGGGHSLL